MLLALSQGLLFAIAPLTAFSPFKIFILSSSLDHGWRKSLPLALTPLMGDIPVILLMWLVIRQLPDWVKNSLLIVGALFYVYLAIGIYRRANRTMNAQTLEEAPRRTFWQALTAIWISPGVYINWGVIGVPAVIGFAEQSPLHAAAFLFGFYVLWVGGLAVQIVIFGQARHINPNLTRYLIYVASLLMIIFAGIQFWTGLSGLISSATYHKKSQRFIGLALFVVGND